MSTSHENLEVFVIEDAFNHHQEILDALTLIDEDHPEVKADVELLSHVLQIAKSELDAYDLAWASVPEGSLPDEGTIDITETLPDRIRKALEEEPSITEDKMARLEELLTEYQKQAPAEDLTAIDEADDDSEEAVESTGDVVVAADADVEKFPPMVISEDATRGDPEAAEHTISYFNDHPEEPLEVIDVSDEADTPFSSRLDPDAKSGLNDLLTDEVIEIVTEICSPDAESVEDSSEKTVVGLLTAPSLTTS